MPIIQSAKKRVKVAAKAAARNLKTKRALREAMKELQTALASGKTAEITAAHVKATSAVDTAAKKNVIHKNKAARKKSQLAKMVKTAGAKPEAKKTVKKVTTPSKKTTKLVAKKAAKPTAKKTTKPTAKK